MWIHKHIISLKASEKKQIALLLTTYNLSHTVNFVTGIQNSSSTAIDNIFVDNSRINLSSVSPIINGLSNHDAQILTVKNICETVNKFSLNQRTRLIDSETITNFQTLLKEETWKSIYVDKYPNHTFNSFFCTLLNIFKARFPVKHKSMKDKNDWITQGIKISCKQNEVCMPSLRTPVIQKHYVKYCKILQKL